MSKECLLPPAGSELQFIYTSKHENMKKKPLIVPEMSNVLMFGLHEDTDFKQKESREIF